MRLLFKLSFLISTLVFGGCSNEIPTITDSSLPEDFSYDIVVDKFIKWNNTFEVEEHDYYVYFFSPTCSHCNKLKNFIIPIIKEKGNIYLVESCAEIKFVKDTSMVLGVDNISDFGIIGYPTLVRISDKKVDSYFIGVQSIKNELTN